MKDKHTAKVTRRTFLKLAGGGLLALVAGCGSAPKAAVEKARAAAEPLSRPIKKAVRSLTGDTSLDAEHIRQMITRDSKTSRTVMWHSDEAQDGAEVAWRVAGSDECETVPATSDYYDDDGQAIYLHSAHIEGLSAGQRYEYRLIAGEEGTEWMTMETDSGGDFTALIFPDTQCSDGYITWREVAEAAALSTPEANFFINMGDLVDNGEDHNQWNQWLDGAESMLTRIPLAPIMGNHETYTIDWQTRLPRAYLALFDVPGNGSGEFDRYYYSFDYGDVHFIALNTQENEIDEHKGGLIDEQLLWLRRDLAATKKKWKVVLMHRDVLQYRINGRPERQEGISEDGAIFMPIFDEYDVDVVLTAHLHTYRDRGHLFDFKPSDGGRGPLYVLTGVAGNVRYPGLWIDHAFDRVTAPQPETDNYITMRATRDELNFKCFLPDGTVIDDVSVRK